MSLGNRYSARHDTFAMHKAAGVDATAYWAFQPGERVRVKEGFEGRVTEVQDGPIGGAEIYIVVLDGGVGGGEYDANELARIGAEVPDRLQANASKREEPEDDWLGTHAAGPHVASEDYPELAEILERRPPLPHSIKAQAAKDPRFEGVALKEDDDGWYVSTHRARSDSYPTPEDIPQSKVDFIESTGSMKTAADIYDPRRLKGDIFGFEHNGRWLLGEAQKASGGEVKTIMPFGSSTPLPADGLELWPIPRHLIVDGEGLRRAYSPSGFASKEEAARFAIGFTMANGPLTEHMEQSGQWTSPRPPWFRSDKEYEDHMRRTREMVDRTMDRTSVAKWVVTDEQGQVLYGPVDSSFAAHDAQAQLPGQTFVQNLPDQQAYQGWGTGEEATVDMPYSAIASAETPVHIGGLNDMMSDKNKFDPRGNYSFDWCRFRRKERCYYPKELDYEATKAEGYSVWVPVDRGFCPRAKWDDQRACTMAEPGPNSGEPNSLLDATIPYEDGGQRGGVPVRASLSGDSLSGDLHGLNCPACQGEGYGGPFGLPQEAMKCGKCDGKGNVDARRLAALMDLPTPTPHEVDLLVTAAADPEFSFHFTASWSDVQKKAKRIRSTGGVRILSVLTGSLTAEVKGDTNVYQTTLIRQAGRSAVDMWECGCKWASYAWGRSGRWKQYEGRMCSHALALTYEAAAQEWMGGTVQEQSNAPDWSRGVKPVIDQRGRPSAWQIGQPKRSALTVEAMPPIAANPTIEEIVDWYEDLAHREEPRTTSLFRQLAEHNMGDMEGLDHRFKSPDKIKEKIERKRPSGDPRTWISDALRYTMVFHPALYSAQVQDVLYGLQEAGYKILSEENTWQRGDTYSALHYTLETPGGAPVELQFHTGESFTLKEKTLHKLYEEFRKPSTPLRRKQELFDIMTAYWDRTEIPEGALEFPVEKRYPKPASANPYLHQSLAATIKEAWAGQGVLVKFKGRVLKLLALLPGRMVKLQGDIIASADEIVHAKWDPVEGLRFQPTATLQAVAETITFETEDLYQLMGELALPPWDDQQGGYLGGDLDCAPMAEHIDQRVQETRIAAMDEDMFSEAAQVEVQHVASTIDTTVPMPGEWAPARFWVDHTDDPVDWCDPLDPADAPCPPAVAILHDEPEPALPTTEGEVVAEIPASEIDQHVQAALVAQGAAAPPVANGLEWLMQGSPAQQSANAEIAAGAAAFLAKTAGKKFSPAEQRAIINEGEGVTAANLSDLDIAGTHYEALDAMSSGDGQLW